MTAELSDGVIFLRPLHPGDAADHLAGEDEEMAKWLSGGRSTLATVQSYINSCEEQWRIQGPRRAFGICYSLTKQLIGSIEANFGLPLAAGQVNISFGVFPDWRGKGILQRVLDLMSSYLKSATGARQMVVRISVGNHASLKAINKAGFQFVGVFGELEGAMARYVRDI
ncbi:MAG TPA: GNAT family protein [Bryobacteraceae bacterium]|nr:GNAT family protein [Bryobacteraceae bacterium]